jgi:hypothetical protein
MLKVTEDIKTEPEWFYAEAGFMGRAWKLYTQTEEGKHRKFL